MLNDLKDLLADFSPRLAFMWAAWMTVGLALNYWHRHAKRNQVTMHGPSTRPKSDVRGPKPPSGVRTEAPVPAPAADAFGELEALLDTPAEPAPTGAYRRPGEDSPVLSEAAPALAAPRALP
jgi:hypothetical protein